MSFIIISARRRQVFDKNKSIVEILIVESFKNG